MNTGYPSIDKPWMKYYEGRKCFFVNQEQTLFDFAYEANKEYLDTTAIEYLGRKITYRSFFNKIEKCRDNLAALGIGKGDIITVQSLAVPQAYTWFRIASNSATIYLEQIAGKSTIVRWKKSKGRNNPPKGCVCQKVRPIDHA